MPSPVAQMIIDLMTNGQLDIADIQAIDQTATELLIKANLRGMPGIGSPPPFPAMNITATRTSPGTIYGTKDVVGNPIEYDAIYWLTGDVSPKYLRGITGKAHSRAPRSRWTSNRIDFEVDPQWRPRCKRFVDQHGRMSVPGNVMQKVKA